MKLLVSLALLVMVAAAAAADYPAPVQALIAQGVQVEAQFPAPGGMTGYAARYQGQPLALYLTADGKQVIVGTMLDAAGENLSAGQLDEYLPEPDFDKAWPLLEQTAWVREGAADAKRIVYVFSDPNCPYCNAFWQATQPYIGKDLQVRHIMVGILSESSRAKAAAILAAKNPAAALAQHERTHSSGGIAPLENIPAAIQQKLASNVELMRELGAHGTPAIFYKDREGKVRGITGMPQPDVLKREIVQVEK
jgi:thiol:disulfide interchange protein DsbG